MFLFESVGRGGGETVRSERCGCGQTVCGSLPSQADDCVFSWFSTYGLV